MTSSTGCSGLTRLGSPPSRAMPSRIAARSTTAGTPVKSCRSTRAGREGDFLLCRALDVPLARAPRCRPASRSGRPRGAADSRAESSANTAGARLRGSRRPGERPDCTSEPSGRRPAEAYVCRSYSRSTLRILGKSQSYLSHAVRSTGQAQSLRRHAPGGVMTQDHDPRGTPDDRLSQDGLRPRPTAKGSRAAVCRTARLKRNSASSRTCRLGTEVNS